MPNQRKQVEGVEDANSGSKLYAEQTRHTKAKASQEEIKLRKIQGELVERTVVEKAQFSSYRRVRDGLLNIPARISGQLAAESDQQRIFAMLMQEITQTLEGLSGIETPKPKRGTA